MTTYYTTYEYVDGTTTIHAIGYGYPAYRELLNSDPYSLEELQALLTEYPDISHVGVPHSYIGYGAPLAYLANSDHLDNHFSDVAKLHNCEHIVSRAVILAGTHAICELFEPWEYGISLDEDATYAREYEALLEEVVDSLETELWRREIDYPDTEELTLWVADHWELTEGAHIDNDGYTPYVPESVVEALADRFMA